MVNPVRPWKAATSVGEEVSPVEAFISPPAINYLNATPAARSRLGDLERALGLRWGD
jgi:hypothetical protein